MYCSTSNAQDEDDFSAFEEQMLGSTVKIYDPLEPLNRKIFTFNDYVDEYFLNYVVDSYRFIVPEFARKGVRNFFDNLYKPFSIINSFAQGKTDNGLASLSSFVINTTVGVFGFIDVAQDEEVFYNVETFGQTLGHYGIGTGPYLVLPLLGPSTLRGFSSDALQSALSPIGFDVLLIGDKVNVDIEDDTKIGLTALQAIDKKESISSIIEDIKKDSFDYYSTVRSYYLQNLESKVKR